MEQFQKLYSVVDFTSAVHIVFVVFLQCWYFH